LSSQSMMCSFLSVR